MKISGGGKGSVGAVFELRERVGHAPPELRVSQAAAVAGDPAAPRAYAIAVRIGKKIDNNASAALGTRVVPFDPEFDHQDVRRPVRLLMRAGLASRSGSPMRRVS